MMERYLNSSIVVIVVLSVIFIAFVMGATSVRIGVVDKRTEAIDKRQDESLRKVRGELEAIKKQLKGLSP